jgi:chaperone modulatory protein CbpM
MNRAISTVLHGSVVEDEVQLTIVELGRACEAPEEQIELWVLEGVLEPSGRSPQEWRFGGASLARVRLASRLARDLELNASGVALAIDLLERIDALESRLGR